MADQRPLSPARAFATFAIPSGLAVAIGCLIVHLNGAPASLWMLNAGAWVAGALVCLALMHAPPRIAIPVLLVITPIALAATLLAPGLSGVHRWIGAGPLNVNVAAILLPPLVVALGANARSHIPTLVSALACLAVLLLQPDASQTTAVMAAIIAILCLIPGQRALRIAGGVVAIAAAIGVWLRSDPLAPVPEVEGVMGLAFDASLFLGLLGLALLAAASAAPPLIIARSAAAPTSIAAFALGAYLLAAAATPFAGHFPVPLLGMSISPIIGYWLGAGLLLALVRRQSPPAGPAPAIS